MSRHHQCPDVCCHDNSDAGPTGRGKCPVVLNIAAPSHLQLMKKDSGSASVGTPDSLSSGRTSFTASPLDSPLSESASCSPHVDSPLLDSPRNPPLLELPLREPPGSLPPLLGPRPFERPPMTSLDLNPIEFNPAEHSEKDLAKLVYCYFGIQPFLENAQVVLGDSLGRQRAASESRVRSQSLARGKRSGRHSAATPRAHSDSRRPPPRLSRDEKTAHQLTSTVEKTAHQLNSSVETTAHQLTSSGRRARDHKHGKLSTSAGSPTRSQVNTKPQTSGGADRNSKRGLLPTPVKSPLLQSPVQPYPLLQAPVQSSPLISTPANALPPHAPLDQHLVSLLHKIDVSPAPFHPPPPVPPPNPHPSAPVCDFQCHLPAFVRVPPPLEAPFQGSRSHGSLETELGKFRFPPPAALRRHCSSGAVQEEPQQGETENALECCTGSKEHLDSYDPNLEKNCSSGVEQRSREQARAEGVLKRFNMFRDWDYAPFREEPLDRPKRRRTASVESFSSDDEDQVTVTICQRVGGVFHYIPAQRLLKSDGGVSRDVSSCGDV